MELRESIDYPAFWKAVKACEGDVIFITDDGDRLNLKSTLCQLVLTVYLSGRKHSFHGSILCEFGNDARILREFCR